MQTELNCQGAHSRWDSSLLLGNGESRQERADPVHQVQTPKEHIAKEKHTWRNPPHSSTCITCVCKLNLFTTSTTKHDKPAKSNGRVTPCLVRQTICMSPPGLEQVPDCSRPDL